ncbi:MAG: glycosyltransferase [Magnetococcales bacterium]|nr:glycosyltransferase [Magnetococcales bacterium]
MVSESKLTVVQIVPEMHAGGVERGVMEVAASLVARGHRSLVISGGGQLVTPLTQAGSEHIQWPVGKKSPLTLRWIWPLRRLLKEHQVDIVHVRSRVPAWLAWLAWRGMDPVTRPRYVTTMHGLHSVSRYSQIMTSGERVIAVSQALRTHILENYPSTDPDKLVLIHRGVDKKDFPFGHQPDKTWLDAWYQDYPKLKQAKVITLAGRLTRLKGHATFLKLIERLKTRYPDIHGLVVGGEDKRRQGYAQELYAEVAKKGLPITFTGARSDIREIYAVSDLVLSLSSRPESFGRTVLEALYLGRPVIGWDHGGVGEILADLLPEGRVKLDDLDGLVQRCDTFFSQAPTMKPVTRFSLQEMLDQTHALYHSMRR